MLVLARRDGEAIIIKTPDNHKIEIFVTRLGKSQTKLAIKANRDIQILRHELLSED